jgi:membrane-bound lytic murein transglycosylase D
LFGPRFRRRVALFVSLTCLASASALATGPVASVGGESAAGTAAASAAATMADLALLAALNQASDNAIAAAAIGDASDSAVAPPIVPAAMQQISIPATPAAQDAASDAARAGDPVVGVPVPATAALPDTAAEAVPATQDRDLWDRIRRGFKMPELTGKRAQSSTRWYAARPDYIDRMTARASLYLYHIVDEIEKRDMPMEIALLPFVESAMQPEAVSFAKAAGLWQFIPSTGRKYSLDQNMWKDERLGVIESTRAALDYLQALYVEFGDWQLALAAYNYGENGVERALARARAAHRSTAYSDLRLPTETQFYVPKLQAIKNIINDPARYGITLPEIANEPYFVAFNKLIDIDVATAARLAEMPIEEFRALNPAFNRPVIIGASSPTILVPAEKADAFEANLAAWQSTGQPLASWTTYKLQAGETLAKVAERAGISEAQLRAANHIPARYRPAHGSIILIPRDESMNDDISADLVEASFALEPEAANLHQVTYRVRRGDTLAAVAKRWHVSADDIVSWNQLNSMTLFTGQRLTLTVARPVAAKPAATPVAHRATTTTTTKRKPPAATVGSNADTTTLASSSAAAHAVAASAVAGATPSRM